MSNAPLDADGAGRRFCTGEGIGLEYVCSVTSKSCRVPDSFRPARELCRMAEGRRKRELPHYVIREQRLPSRIVVNERVDVLR